MRVLFAVCLVGGVVAAPCLAAAQAANDGVPFGKGVAVPAAQGGAPGVRDELSATLDPHSDPQALADQIASTLNDMENAEGVPGAGPDNVRGHGRDK